MAKEILEYIKLEIPAGAAVGGPPVGPALGQRGLNISNFVKAFNERNRSNNPLPHAYLPLEYLQC